MTIKLDKDQNKAFNKKAYNKSNANSTGYRKTILATQLDEAFKRFNDKFTFDYEPKQGDLGWHPSGDCLPPVTRLWGYAYFALNGTVPGAPENPVKKDLNHLNKIFMVGHYWHQVIQHIIVKEGWAKPEAIEGIGYCTWGDEWEFKYVVNALHPDTAHDITQHEAKPFHYVRGQGDVAPLVMPDWTGLVDIKTMNPSDFKAGLAQSRFSNKYLCQINMYMHIFDLDQAIILAVDKGSSAFQEYTFVRDQILIDQILAKWQRVSYCLDHDIIPTEADNKLFELSIGDE